MRSSTTFGHGSPKATVSKRPSRDGFASVLEVVEDAPAHFARAAPSFADLGPTYVRALLNGLDGALKENRDFDWASVLDLIATISDRPEDPEAQLSDGRDPNWSSSWQQALELILHGLAGSAENKIGGDLFDVVTKISRGNVERPDPYLTEEREDSQEPESVAVNSVRCTALRTAIALAARRREADAGGDEGLDPDIAACSTPASTPRRSLSRPCDRSSVGISGR